MIDIWWLIVCYSVKNSIEDCTYGDFSIEALNWFSIPSTLENNNENKKEEYVWSKAV